MKFTEKKLRGHPHLQRVAELRCATTMQIVHIQHYPEDGEASYKDVDFSASTLSQRRDSGYRDTCRLLERQAWMEEPPRDLGLLVYEPSGLRG